jgi:hypothetical protein
MSEIPSVKVLEAIKPINPGTGEDALVYCGLSAAVASYMLTNGERSAEVWDAEPGSLEELSSAKQLASEYLLRTSDKVVGSNNANRDLWAGRFIQAASELYGQPEAQEVIRLIASDYEELTQLKDKAGISQQHVNFLLDTYRPIIEGLDVGTEPAEVAQEKAAIHEYGKAILDKYKPLFDMVDESGKSSFNATEIRDIFGTALSWLVENDDPQWEEWEVVDYDKGTSVSVSASNRQIRIPSEREPALALYVKALIAHELLVHALRAKNGYKTDDKKLATGLSGYLDAEEGLGVLAEEAVNGKFLDKVHDNYLDIAFALGICDGVQRKRKALFQISFARQLIQEQVNGTISDITQATLERKVWRGVDRIYRGGPGDDLGTVQAIFTKDIAYYVGYKQMAQYISNQLHSGKSAAEVFKYLSQGKFDPSNPKHTERLAKAIN